MLEIRNLVKKFGDKVAVDNVSIKAEAGEIYGFIGHNGAGKTTTIKSIVGIHKYDSGEILVNGVEVSKNPLECKKQIAYIPDNPDLYEYLTGIAYLNFIADIYEVDTVKRKELIELYAKKLELYDNLSSEISSYSHGMKQKLAIISALIHKPKLLILDEPFVGLDPKAQFTLKELMKELCSEGMTVFFSSHVLEVVEKLCSRIAIINKGIIVKEGLVSEIIKTESLEKVFLSTLEEE